MSQNMKKPIAVFVLAALSPLGLAQAKDAADLILYNGKVLTVDKDFSIKSAIAVKDGKILAVGGEEIAKNYSAPKMVDLKGRTLMPGFMDNHLHPKSMSHRAIDPTKANSIVDIQSQLRAKAKELGPGEWITGYGWDEALLKEKRNLTRKDLDVATPNNPVKTPAKKFGLFVAFGSDNLPIDPRVGLYFAVTRRGPDGVQHGFAEEAVSREDAIRMYTANGPYLSWEENVKGTLEPGKLADFVVVDRDPLTVPEKELLTMNFDQTYLDGKLVYERKAGELTASIR